MIPRAALACTKPVRADKRSRKAECSTPQWLTNEAVRLSVVHRKGWQTTTKSECRARAGFHTPTHASNYLQTDGQLLTSGNEPATASYPSWPRFSRPSISSFGFNRRLLVILMFGSRFFKTRFKRSISFFADFSSMGEKSGRRIM